MAQQQAQNENEKRQTGTDTSQGPQDQNIKDKKWAKKDQEDKPTESDEMEDEDYVNEEP